MKPLLSRALRWATAHPGLVAGYAVALAGSALVIALIGWVFGVALLTLTQVAAHRPRPKTYDPPAWLIRVRDKARARIEARPQWKRSTVWAFADSRTTFRRKAGEAESSEHTVCALDNAPLCEDFRRSSCIPRDKGASHGATVRRHRPQHQQRQLPHRLG